jgi:diaminohydroxyphosphoribosylaminopyrimidine deaminase/5-amino-6-(5-phosphoribosylamino)uracil reductase
MAQALRLASRGEGRTAPNPPVGAVVVQEGRIVGQGWHRAAGQPHAEVEALHEAGELARGAELYVTLEPCNHHGQTPPCTEAVLAAGIRRVFVAVPDPNPRVKGGGAGRLEAAGVEVETGLLAERGRDLLAPFTKRAMTGRPWVVLKMAASLDGRIATAPGRSEWLTGPTARAWVHRLRNVSEAILVGAATVRVDNPRLTTRLPQGGGQNPLRVIVDSRLSLSPQAQVVTGPRAGGPAGGGCLIYATPQAPAEKRRTLEAAGARVRLVKAVDGRADLFEIIEDLGKIGVMRLLVEGGPTLAGALVRQGLVDEVDFILTPRLVGGREAPGLLAGPVLAGLGQAARLSRLTTRRLGPDLLVRGWLEGGAEPCSPA